MKIAYKIFTFIFLLALAYSCGPQKDNILRRNYQALTTKYNVLFNGKEAFRKGIEDINNNYKDDWFKQLPIEPIAFEEDKFVVPKFNNGPGAGFNNTDSNTDNKKELTTFDKAEEKAVKAIQKHGMNINGIERNRQIDDAYLLLGKSRYYQQRFIPAIEAFNYVIAKYPNANLIAETKIWRAKANIRNDNEETAIEAMKLLLIVKDTLEVEWPNVIKEQGYTALAMAYVSSDSLQKAKKNLHLATRTLENKDQGARNLFILGQMYAKENKKDSANNVFQRLVNFNKAPKKYKIRANLELAKNTTNDSSAIVLLEKLKKLIKDRDNRPYLDALYYQSAVLHENNDSITLAKEFYNKSLRAKNAGEKQKTYTYENLGNLYFKDSEYQKASAYFDSVMQISTDSLDLRIRRVRRKFKNLASLIKYEETITLNDSILKISKLTKEEQNLFFENYIKKLKKADEDAAQLRLNQMAFANSGSNLLSTKKGEWYFYNAQSINFGKTEFQKTWGNRKLEDNWRWSEKTTIGGQIKDSAQVSKPNARYDLETYLSKIPTEKVTLDSLVVSRNQALYEVGLVYKEQFKDKKLAKERLLRVASLSPKKELILPINWHLYQLFTQSGDIEEAEIYKNVILTKYAETNFAKLILKPNQKIEENIAVDEVEITYKEMYYLYKQAKYKEVIEQINTVIPTIQNSKLLPKFELLKAYAIGKNENKNTYIEALEFVSVNYGSTEEGKKAKTILTQLKK